MLQDCEVEKPKVGYFDHEKWDVYQAALTRVYKMFAGDLHNLLAPRGLYFACITLDFGLIFLFLGKTLFLGPNRHVGCRST